jgi:type IV secretion system protein VirB9
MNALLLALALAAAPTATPPHAAAPATRADPRIISLNYDPGQVYRLTGGLRTALQVIFGPSETIAQVALGDSSGWEVAAAGNVLYLKPTARRAPTNMIVTTRTGGVLRHYAFDMDVSGGHDLPVQVRFRYPDDEAARLKGSVDQRAYDLQQLILKLKLEQAALEGPRNLAYALTGPADLAPSEVTDNGRFTVLRFPGAQAMPAVYAIAPDGSESLVAFDVRGEFLVVHGVYRALRLRRGASQVCVFNQAFDPRGRGLPTGAAAPDVRRADINRAAQQ